NSKTAPIEDVSTSKIVDDLVDITQVTMAQETINFEIGEIPDIMISCRASEISQILLNLTKNAADAVRELPNGQIKLKCVKTEKDVKFAVSDNGPGIPPELLPRTLNSSFTTKNVGEGTGL